MRGTLPIKIALPEGFLNKEVRCGYEVSEKLKRIWAVELDLLSKFLDVCRRYDIKAQIFAGTLLGAVRHKGMIPWDDDIDVALTRGEFEKLLKVPTSEFERPYFLQTALSDRRHFIGYARLRNSETTAAISGYEGADYNNGIYIDIFVLDGLGGWNGIQKRCLQFLLRPIVAYYYSGWGSWAHKVLYSSIKPFAHLLRYERYVQMYAWCISRLSGKSEWNGLLTHEKKFRRYALTKCEMDDSIPLQFEFLKVPAPRNYDQILTRIYGNYMDFPPASERGKWHEDLIHFEPDMAYEEYFAAP